MATQEQLQAILQSNEEKLKEIIRLTPYKVELAVIDYQDEGISLDVFVWKDLYTTHDIFPLAVGNVIELKQLMLLTHEYLIKHDVKSEYTLHVEVC